MALAVCSSAHTAASLRSRNLQADRCRNREESPVQFRANSNAKREIFRCIAFFRGGGAIGGSASEEKLRVEDTHVGCRDLRIDEYRVWHVVRGRCAQIPVQAGQIVRVAPDSFSQLVWKVFACRVNIDRGCYVSLLRQKRGRTISSPPAVHDMIRASKSS